MAQIEVVFNGKVYSEEVSGETVYNALYDFCVAHEFQPNDTTDEEFVKFLDENIRLMNPYTRALYEWYFGIE